MPCNWFFIYTGRLYSVTKQQRQIQNNCLAIRQRVQEYVQARKRGEIKSKVQGTDFLELFLQNNDVFTEEFIIDELLDFFLAAMLTTQLTTQAMVSHFIKDRECPEKVRKEFEDRVVKD
jgi:cytochrome P450